MGAIALSPAIRLSSQRAAYYTFFLPRWHAWQATLVCLDNWAGCSVVELDDDVVTLLSTLGGIGAGCRGLARRSLDIIAPTRGNGILNAYG